MDLAIKEIADFLLHLFFRRENYNPIPLKDRFAIADKIGNSQVNISQNENLNRLLDIFHRDRPRFI